MTVRYIVSLVACLGVVWLSPSMHKYGKVFLPSGLSAEGATAARAIERDTGPYLRLEALSEPPAMLVASQVRMSPVDLVQTTLNAPGKIKVGKKFRVMDELESVGESSAAMSVTYFYLSKDDKVDAIDIVVAGRRVPPLRSGSVNRNSPR